MVAAVLVSVPAQTVAQDDDADDETASSVPFGRDPAKDIDVSSEYDGEGFNVPLSVWSDGSHFLVMGPLVSGVFAYDAASGERSPDHDIDWLSDAGVELPKGLWSDGTTLWVGDLSTDKVLAFDIATRRHLPGLSFEPPFPPGHMWADGETLWLADSRGDAVQAFDLATGEPLSGQRIELDLVVSGVWSDGETMWVSDVPAARIHPYNIATGERVPDLEFDALQDAGNHKPAGLWSDGNTMWVVDAGERKLFAYNMPASAMLASLEFGGIDFTTFHPGRRDYSLSVPTSTASVTVSAAAASPDAQVSISPADANGDLSDGHQVAVGTGDVVLTVSVTNGDASSEYTMTLSRSAHDTLSGDTSLAALELTDVDIARNDDDVSRYSGAVGNSVSRTTVTATSSDIGATVSISEPDADADADADGYQVDLAEGVNVIAITVESSDGQRRQVHRVTVERASLGDFGWNPVLDVVLDGPTGHAAIWSDGSTLWVLNLLLGQILAYDRASGARQPDHDITSLAAAGNSHPRGIWSDGDTMWVSDLIDDKVYAYALDGGERSPGHEFDLTRDNWSGEGLWSDGTTMWVTDGQRVFAYVLATGVRDSAKDLPAPHTVHENWSNLLCTDGNLMWLKYLWRDTLFAYSRADGTRVPEADAVVSPTPAEALWCGAKHMLTVDHATGRIRTYNMPEWPALASLELDGADIGLFQPARFSYAAAVTTTTTSVTVAAEAAFAGSTVSVSPADADADTEAHDVSLVLGANEIMVTVTHGSDTRTYGVTVYRTAAEAADDLSDDATLLSLTLGDLDIGTFHPDITEYEVTADDVSAATLTATATDPNAVVSIRPADADADTDVHEVSLPAGRNVIVVDVTSSDLSRSRQYRITVWRPSVGGFGAGDLPDFRNIPEGRVTARAIWSDGTTMWVAILEGPVLAYTLDTMQRDPARDLNAPDIFDEPYKWWNPGINGLWSDGTTMWTSDDHRVNVAAYDLADDSFVRSKSIGGLWQLGITRPAGMWSDGTTLWVGDALDVKLYAFNLADRQRRPSLDLNGLGAAGNSRPRGLWSDGTTMWVADDEDDKVYAYRLSDGQRTPSLDLDMLIENGNNTPKGIWSDGETMFVSDPDDARIYAYPLPVSARLSSQQQEEQQHREADESETVEMQADESEGAEQRSEGSEPEPDGSKLPPLTASFEELPDAHGGSGSDLVVRVRYSEPLAVSYVTMRDGGAVWVSSPHEVIKAKRVEGASDLWEFTIRVGGDDRLTLTVFKSSYCDRPHSVCTADGRPVSESTQVFIDGPEPSGEDADEQQGEQQQGEQQQGEQQQGEQQQGEQQEQVVVVRAEDEIGEVVLSSDAAGELTISWEAPALAPFEYRVSWAHEDLEFLSFRFENEAHRGNEWPAADATSVTLSGLGEGAVYKVQLRARFRDAQGKVSASPWTTQTTATVHSAASLPAQQQAEQDDGELQLIQHEEQNTDDEETKTAEVTISAPARPTVADAGINSISVQWSAPENPSTPITGYDLRYRAVGATEWSEGPQDVTASPAEITGLQADTAYEVAVKSQGVGAEGDWSEPGRGSTAFWVATLTVGSLDQSTDGYWGFQNKLNRFGDLTPRTVTRDGVNYEFFILAWYRGYRVDADGRTHTEALDFYGYDHVMPADWVLRIEDRRFFFRDATRGFLQTSRPQQTRQYKVYWRHPELSLELGSQIEVSLSQEPTGPSGDTALTRLN